MQLTFTLLAAIQLRGVKEDADGLDIDQLLAR
jgi:hypothetical protein